MIELHKEKKINYTVYQAIDGTIFEDKEECKKYDNSAQAVLLAKYKSYVINTGTEEEIFGHGSQDYYIDVVRVNDPIIIDTVCQLFVLINTYGSAEDRIKRLNKTRDRLQRALLDDDYIFIGRGCIGNDNDTYDDFYVYETRAELLDNINRNCKLNGKL